MEDHHDDRSLIESIQHSEYRNASPEARERLLGLLALAAASPDRKARNLAASRLWFHKDAGTVVEDLLATLLDDDDDRVRLMAAKSATRVSDRCRDDLAPRIVPIFLDAVGREQGVGRTYLIQFLGKFPRFADAILPTLIEALGSDDPFERFCATMSLQKFGGAAAPAAGAIRQAIERETDFWVKPNAVMDLRMVHAETLFKVIGDNAWSRAVATERLHDAQVSESIRRGARLLLDMLDGPERT